MAKIVDDRTIVSTKESYDTDRSSVSKFSDVRHMYRGLHIRVTRQVMFEMNQILESEKSVDFGITILE